MAQILLVDDEGNIRTMIRLILEDSGYAVDTASDGPEALAKFGSGAGFDLVLLDQRMPGMEGLEVLRRMRDLRPGVKIVMITAFGTIDLAVDAMKAGATDFLRKPFTDTVLLGAVQAALKGTVGKFAPAQTAEEPISFGLTTINGYWIQSQPESTVEHAGDRYYVFKVQSPGGDVRQCTVVLPPYVVELVKAHADCERLPGGDRFWQALCEEALANYLWQNADYPEENSMRVEDLTSGLRHWVDAVMVAAR